jgi:hypothetical protein
MAAKDLIILTRAYSNIQGVSGVDALLQTLLTAASDAIEKYCRRDFLSTSYDELYSGNGDRKLMLRQYPLVSVQSVRYRPVTVMKITNTDATNVQARASVTSTGLTLVRVKNGVKTTDTSITFAGNVTLTAVAAAVNGCNDLRSAAALCFGYTHSHPRSVCSKRFIRFLRESSRRTLRISCRAGSNGQMLWETAVPARSTASGCSALRIYEATLIGSSLWLP